MSPSRDIPALLRSLSRPTDIVVKGSGRETIKAPAGGTIQFAASDDALRGRTADHVLDQYGNPVLTDDARLVTHFSRLSRPA